MIRLCDKQTCCIGYNELKRDEIFHYFLDGNLDETICIFDIDGSYIGYITYPTLMKSSNIDMAIIKEQLVLDENIWINARKLFTWYEKQFGGMGCHTILPVLDQNRQLICFAYEDLDANRELRMLRELQESRTALQFSDVYPEYQCVRIHQFNELAYFFARYLVSQRIAVQVNGIMWDGFFVSTREDFLDCQSMDIYAEGIYPKPEIWTENLLRSASVEFECIDHIYEENIKAGIIKNADMDTEDFLQYLKESDEIVILGTDMLSLDAYDYLKKRGIEICCFVTTAYCPDRPRLFGKPVLRRIDAMEIYAHAIFITPYEKGSAWGMGEADFFDYLGYKRNKDFFLLQDYVKVETNCLKDALRNQKVVLAGDVCFCEKLADYFEEKNVCGKDSLEFISLSDDRINAHSCIKKCRIENDNSDKICLIVVPEGIGVAARERSENKKRQIISVLTDYGLDDYTDYFSYMHTWIYMEADRKDKYQTASWKPKRIILGAISSKCGNVFFRGLLDNHPSIVMMDYNHLNHNLFWFCICLSGKTAAEIPELFSRLYDSEWEGEKLKDIELFMKKMEQLLENGKVYTSQELFVIIHMAYMYMYGKDIEELSDKIIYWEAHHMDRNILEECSIWLGTGGIQCDIINILRNLCTRNGSLMKAILVAKDYGNPFEICNSAILLGHDGKKYPNCERLVVKFEDLKLRPEEELCKICQKWDIPWSDSLMHTTLYGTEEYKYWNKEKLVQGFDLSPVFNTYEEFFSEFDRFKITLICAPWQKKYGYSYVDYSQFSKRELQEIFLKDFKFMERICFDSERTHLEFRLKFQRYVRMRLQKLRLMSYEGVIMW